MPDAETRGRAPGHIVIVGAMGSGKTTLARELAEELGWDFFDSDISIRDRTGRTGREIAETDGVDELHRLEIEALFDALAGPAPAVVAAAASVIEDSEVRMALDDTFCVWVTAGAEILAHRSARGTHRRAVAESEHLEHRDSLFARAADLVIDTGALSERESVDQVLAILKGGSR
ncbi:MAG: shikimate kinase [Acidimicrobiia bacterium]